MNVYEEIEKIFGSERLDEYKANPKDKTGEREGFVNMVTNRAVTLMGYGVVSNGEYKKIKDFMKKTIDY